MSRYRELSPDQAVAEAGAPWGVVDGLLTAGFVTGSMTKGLEFVARVVGAAEAADHHPDIDFRYPSVTLALTTHAVGGLTDADARLAAAVTLIAADLNIPPVPAT